MKIKEIKNSALTYLEGRWLQALAVVITILTIHFLFTAIENVVYDLFFSLGLVRANMHIFPPEPLAVAVVGARYVLQTIAITPAFVGAIWWYLHAVRGEHNSVSDMFICYRNVKLFFKAILIRGIKAGIGILVFLPSAIVAYATYSTYLSLKERGSSAAVLIILLVLFIVLAFCFAVMAFWFMLQYFLTSYIFAVNPDLSAVEMIKISVNLMKNRRGDLIKTVLSFLPWLITAIFIFPLFFVVPYFAMAVTEVADDIMSADSRLNMSVSYSKIPMPHTIKKKAE